MQKRRLVPSRDCPAALFFRSGILETRGWLGGLVSESIPAQMTSRVAGVGRDPSPSENGGQRAPRDDDPRIPELGCLIKLITARQQIRRTFGQASLSFLRDVMAASWCVPHPQVCRAMSYSPLHSELQAPLMDIH